MGAPLRIFRCGGGTLVDSFDFWPAGLLLKLHKWCGNLLQTDSPSHVGPTLEPRDLDQSRRLAPWRRSDSGKSSCGAPTAVVINDIACHRQDCGAGGNKHAAKRPEPTTILSRDCGFGKASLNSRINHRDTRKRNRTVLQRSFEF